MVKGYDHFAGRALVSLDVLAGMARELKGYEILVYSATGRTHRRVAELRAAGELDIRVLDWCTHDRMLQYFGHARLYLGVSISDGISTSALDAMAMGAFPIQTNTSCCGEWFEDGSGGLLIAPDYPAGIATALRRALAEDALVDRAAELNAGVVRERLAVEVITPKVRDFYDQAFGHLAARRVAAD
jgi:glycosyltransferase involved in cell wall biosynthesis